MDDEACTMHRHLHYEILKTKQIFQKNFRVCSRNVYFYKSNIAMNEDGNGRHQMFVHSDSYDTSITDG